jgi:hypothetical protein
MNRPTLCLASLLLVSAFAFPQARHRQSTDNLGQGLQHFREMKPDSVLKILNTAGHRASNGDRRALSALFDLSSKSEGYVSEALGTILGNVLLKKTNFFLRSLSLRSAGERKHIALMAFDMGGGGMPESDSQALEKTLLGLASGKHSRLSRAATSCLQALDLVRRQPKQ